MAWLIFILSAAAIAAAGVRLARDADEIAEKTGLGGMWIGAVLVSIATSLPELVTDVSAIRQGAPSLAVGDLFGSSMANVLILAVADLSVRKTRVLTRVSVNQAAVGIISVGLTAVAAVGLVAGGGNVFGLGWSALAVGVAYLAAVRFLHASRSEPPFEREAPTASKAGWREAGVRRALLRFGVASAAILLAGPLLAGSAAELASKLGFSHGLVGMTLLALTTSMPELAVTFAAVRGGAYDLAVGNLLGSNCFNMALLVPLDLAHGPGSLLAAVDRELVVAALASIALTSLAVLDVFDRAERRSQVFELRPWLTILAYATGVVLTARLGG
jgi:cation:H+ antiporter